MLSLYSTSQPNRPSVLVKDEFQATSAFVEAFKKRDLLKIHSIFHKDLYRRMDIFGRQLTNDLINKISPSTKSNQTELQEIIDDKSIDELERRTRMFEWFASTRKNKTTFETL